MRMSDKGNQMDWDDIGYRKGEACPKCNWNPEGVCRDIHRHAELLYEADEDVLLVLCPVCKYTFGWITPCDHFYVDEKETKERKSWERLLVEKKYIEDEQNDQRSNKT